LAIRATTVMKLLINVLSRSIQKKTRHAFTSDYFELLVVIAIIAIMAADAFSRRSRRRRRKSETAAMYQRSLRQMAVGCRSMAETVRMFPTWAENAITAGQNVIDWSNDTGVGFGGPINGGHVSQIPSVINAQNARSKTLAIFIRQNWPAMESVLFFDPSYQASH